jgi:hypothetical protein
MHGAPEIPSSNEKCQKIDVENNKCNSIIRKERKGKWEQKLATDEAIIIKKKGVRP